MPNATDQTPPGSWGRWGEDDQAGALNLVGPKQVLRGAGLVRDGRVLRLGTDLGPGSLVPPHRKRVERFMTRDGGDYAAGARRPGGFQFAEDVVSFSTHSGTHLDALAHAWYDDQLYNGFSSNTVRSTSGASRCGAEHLRPVATRGVLLDVAAGRSTPWGPGEPVTAGDLSRVATAAGVEMEPGDAVLVRTGWLGRTSNDPAEYFAAEPGIDVSAARWLAESDVALVGADNYAVEAQPSAPGTAFPVHQVLVRDYGMPLLENAVLDELAEAGRATFLFVASPLPVVGGTAGPVIPIAVL